MEGSESEKIFDSFNLNPQLFINEVINSVDDLVDEAFDFFQQEAAVNLKTEGTDRSDDLKKGVAYIRNMVQLALDKRLSMWEKYCLRHCFTVPEGFSLPKADEPSGHTSLDLDSLGDAELDAQLDSLRNKLTQVGKESADLNRELRALERQSRMSNHSVATLNEALQFYNEQNVQEKFEELVKTASEFRSSLENHKNRTFTEVEHLRAEKIRKLDGDTLRLNYHGGHDHSGLLNAKLDDLHQFLDSIMTK